MFGKTRDVFLTYYTLYLPLPARGKSGNFVTPKHFLMYSVHPTYLEFYGMRVSMFSRARCLRTLTVLDTSQERKYATMLSACLSFVCLSPVKFVKSVAM